MVRIAPSGVLLPALAGLATGLGILWTFRAGAVGSAAVAFVGFAVSTFLCTRLADRERPWPGLVTGGLSAGIAAAAPVFLVVDVWTNLCVLDCAPPDHGPALRWAGGTLAASLLLHALGGFMVPRPRTAPPLPDLPE